MASMKWYSTTTTALIQKIRESPLTYLWICPFLCRYSNPSNTSLRIVAMAGSSRTPLLCSPFATMCLIISRTEPENRRQFSHKILTNSMIRRHSEIKLYVNLLINCLGNKGKNSKYKEIQKFKINNLFSILI